MKKLLLFLFSLMLSFNSYGEWTKVNENTSDDSYYIDFQTVKPFTKKIMGEDYVVWWEMRDLSEPTDDGKMSSQIYYKGDCEQTRTKFLSMISFTGNMGTGNSEDLSGGFVNLEDLMGWTYPPPDSVTYDNLSIVCEIAQAQSTQSKSDYESRLEEFIATFESYEWGDEANLIYENASSELNDQQQVLQSAWVNSIVAKVRDEWRYQGANENWFCEVYVLQKRNGEVISTNVLNCNDEVFSSSIERDKLQGFKNSLERAVYKASPLPYIEDDSIFDKEITFVFVAN